MDFDERYDEDFDYEDYEEYLEQLRDKYIEQLIDEQIQERIDDEYEQIKDKFILTNIENRDNGMTVREYTIPGTHYEKHEVFDANNKLVSMSWGKHYNKEK